MAFARCRSLLLGPRATSTRACWKPRLAEDVVLRRAQAQKGARVQLRFSCLALSSALPPCSAAGAAAVNREERTRNELSACSLLGYAELCPLFASRLVGVPVAGARVCQPGLASPRSCQALPAVLPCVGSIQTTTGAIGDCSWLLLAVAGSRGLHRRGHVRRRAPRVRRPESFALHNRCVNSARLGAIVSMVTKAARVCQLCLVSPRSCQALPAVLSCVGLTHTTTCAIGDSSWLLLAVARSRGLHRRGHVRRRAPCVHALESCTWRNRRVNSVHSGAILSMVTKAWCPG